MTEILMRVTAVDYETNDVGDDVVLQVAGRDENGERRTIRVWGTHPHFFIREDAPKPADACVVGTYSGYESYDGIPLTKVETEIPGNTNDLVAQYEQTWESDIPYYRRATIDYGLVGHIRVPDADECRIENVETEVSVPSGEEIEPRMFIGDIEVLPSDRGFEEMVEAAEDTISHITIWDSQADEYHALFIDPDENATGTEVKAELEVHAGAESLSRELDRPIHLHRYQTEEDLLEGLLRLFEDRRPDLVSGWNFVDFDWKYLLRRYEAFDGLNEHRLSDIGYINGYQTARKVDCVPAFDMMTARTTPPYEFSEWRSQSLDYVANKDLGVGKIPEVDIGWAFARDMPRLTAYNIMDVMLCVAIERKEDLHAFFYELAELAQVQVYDTAHEMRLVDGYLMSRAGDDEILPPMPDDNDIPPNDGGLVLSPSDGVKDWVGVLDLKSLYPSVIITWNISPETIYWLEDDTPPGDALTIPWMPGKEHKGEIRETDIGHDTMAMDVTTEGLIPKYIRRLFPERARRKSERNKHDPDSDLYAVWDRKQSAVKVIMNSFYGVMSNDYWRLGTYGLGDAVTSAARYTLWKGKQIAEDEGYEVYYGDTDSIMISLADEDEEDVQVALDRGHALEDTINGRMDECVEVSGLDGSHPYLTDDLHGTDRHCLVYEFEKLYRRFFQAGSKKRYGGHIIWKEGKTVNDVDTVGFESQRSDAPEITSDVQPEVIRRILAGHEFDEVSEYIRDIIDDVKERRIDMYRIAMPASLGKPLHAYGNTQVAKACRFSNTQLDYAWGQGSDPWLYFIRETPPMTPMPPKDGRGRHAIALDWSDDLPEGYDLDIDAQLEKAIEEPLRPILKEVGWRYTELRKGAKTGSAADDGWADGDWDEGGEEDETPGWDW